MSAFDKVFGYEAIKNELLQICDMIHNREVYESMGAKLPQGILLYGEPGLGKSLMARCFIEESGLEAVVVRKNMGNDDFIGAITDAFLTAKKAAPAIVFLDDMDKFANEDERHRDAEEYVAVQAGIDDVKGDDVFVFATVNDIQKLPYSLKRSGRFDRKIEVKTPSADDAEQIIKHYLASKRVANSVNLNDLTKMISYSSCAELETILNEAAILAAFSRKEKIEMTDLVKAVLKMQYNSPDYYAKTSEEIVKKVALHEAGHVVISEVLCPESVGLASVRSTGRHSTGGFIHRCKNWEHKEHDILVCLAGKAAVELYYSDSCADGCELDLRRAFTGIRDYISQDAALGFGMLDVATQQFTMTSESMNSRNEAVVQAELSRYMFKVRDILLKNKLFLEEVTAALIEKETLLFSEIQNIKARIGMVDVVA